VDKATYAESIKKFEDEFSKSLKLFHKVVDDFGSDIANSLLTEIRNQGKPDRPEKWPNSNSQKLFGDDLDSMYQMIKPSRTMVGILHSAFNVSSETEMREENKETADIIRGDRPKFGGLTQEITLIRIVEKFLEKIETKYDYSVLHDQPFLKSNNNRWHDCDITIVRKQEQMKSKIDARNLKPLLMLELKSNLDSKKISKFYDDVAITRKYWADKNNKSANSQSPILAAFVFREPDGSLKKLTGSSVNLGLRHLINETDPKYKFQWIEAIENRLECRDGTHLKLDQNPEKIPVFLLPDGGGITNLFNLKYKQDEDKMIFESIQNLPKRPWFGISALIHLIFTAIVLDGGHIPLKK
jgi:hypothetical protein